MISLNTGVEVSFPPHEAEGLQNAEASQLDEIKISPSGFGIRFPKRDADLYIPAVLEGFLGSRKWIAAKLGSAGGQSRSLAKLKAARLNGKLGGRPKQTMSASARKRIAAAQKARWVKSRKAAKNA